MFSHNAATLAAEVVPVDCMLAPGRVQPIPDPFPFWTDTAGQVQEEPLDLLQVAPLAGRARDPISFNSAVMNAGLLHVLHNATQHMGSSIGVLYETTVHQLSCVARLLKRPEYKQRLLERCFRDPISSQFVQEV
eukprot:4312775-Amphidinium_carterae.1